MSLAVLKKERVGSKDPPCFLFQYSSLKTRVREGVLRDFVSHLTFVVIAGIYK